MRAPRVVVLLLAGLLSWQAQAGDAVLERIRRTGVLRVGYPSEALPFSYLAGDAVPVGYSIELCRHAALAIQRELGMASLQTRYVPLAFSERIDAIRGERIDLECGSTTDTPERRRQVAFSRATFAATIKAVVAAQDGAADMRALAGRRIAVVRGTTVGQLVDDIAQRERLRFDTVPVPTLTDALRRLQAGEVDALVFDEVVVAPLMARQPGRFRFLDEALAVEHLGLVMPLDNPGLGRIVDDTLRALMRSGQAQAIYKTWFQSPIAPDGINLQLPLTSATQALFDAAGERDRD